MKITTITIRVLIGVLLLFASISYFLQLFPEPPLSGNMKIFNDGIKASIYLMPLVKGVEFLCGLSFIVGKFNRISYILLLPISINILFTHIFLAPEGLAIAGFLFLGNLFLLYSKWDSYKGLFVA
jgi:putative oxidoreductase